MLIMMDVSHDVLTYNDNCTIHRLTSATEIGQNGMTDVSYGVLTCGESSSDGRYVHGQRAGGRGQQLTRVQHRVCQHNSQVSVIAWFVLVDFKRLCYTA